MATMGEMLRAARTQAGLSLEAVSSATRIPRHNLAALEADNLETLPAEPFTRGLIRVYARALAVPEAPVLNAYAEALRSRRIAATEPDRGLRRRQGRLLVGVVLVAAAALVIFLVVRAGGFAAPADSASPPAMSPEPSIGLRAGSTLQLFALRPTEIAVVVDGQPVFDGQVTAGSSQTFSPRREIAVRANAPDAIEVRIDGSPIGFLGPPGGSFQRTWRVATGG
jgi:cytoskeleton protein RodZ